VYLAVGFENFYFALWQFLAFWVSFGCKNLSLALMLIFGFGFFFNKKAEITLYIHFHAAFVSNYNRLTDG